MRRFIFLFLHELRMLLITPANYVAGALFLLLMGAFYWFALRAFSAEAQEGLPSEQFFQLFWVPVFFIVPLITMKSIAEERRSGTLGTLMTTPVGPAVFVLAKFFSCYLFYILLWALTLLFPLLAYYAMPESAVDPRLLDSASLVGGFAFIAVSGTLFIAIGIFASSLTRTQLVAGMLSFCILFALIILGRLMMQYPMPDVPWLAWVGSGEGYFETFAHLKDFSRGVVDTRPFFLYLSNALLLLGITTLVVEAKT